MRMVFTKGHKLRVGLKHSKEFKEKRKGKGNPYWKGDDATVGSIHSWVRDNFKKADCCEHCGERKKLDWSNKDHKYTRKREDWQNICRRCHIKYDMKHLGLDRVSPNKLNGRWSLKYDRCVICDSNKKKHRSRGHCSRCYYKHIVKTNES